MALTETQLKSIVAVERANAVLSILGIIFIIYTYLATPYFNKPINRLIFFASWGNLGCDMAALISLAGPSAGRGSPLCSFQAFLVQMFLGVDAYWALCMACNVYLVFFRNYTVQQLRALDYKYLIACYGLSFVPALAFLFISREQQGSIYGPAIIWCWIVVSWDWLRILALYAVIWIAILIALIIYVMAARVIWAKRSHLEGFLNPFNEIPFSHMVTTEITISHELRSLAPPAPPTSTLLTSMHCPANNNNLVPILGYRPYSVVISSTPMTESLPSNRPPIPNVRALTRHLAVEGTNPEAWLYARVAFLFFFAIIITWVPSSINRVYSLAHPDEVNFGLNFVSSFVFPLQGLWNAIIYVITSQTACRYLMDDLRDRLLPSRIQPRRSLPERVSTSLITVNVGGAHASEVGHDTDSHSRMTSASSLGKTE